MTHEDHAKRLEWIAANMDKSTDLTRSERTAIAKEARETAMHIRAVDAAMHTLLSNAVGLPRD